MFSGLRQIWRFPLRSFLIVSCAAFGVAAAITAVNYASAGRAQVLEQISRLGSNVIIVSAKQSRAVAGRERTGAIVTTLTPADYRALREQVTGPVPSSALVSSSLRLKAGYLSKVTTVVGVEPDYFPMKAWRLEDGSLFDTEAVRRATRVAILGSGVARDLFESGSPVGERLFINRVPFEVIGVLAERGPGLDQVDEDARVFVPLSAAMRRLLNIDYYNALLFDLPDLQRMQTTEDQLTELLQARHRSSDYRPDDFQVQTQRELIDTQLASADRLSFLVSWISLSILAVSGLGIMSIVWIAVRGRTREIGTRRALGATAGQVFFQFAFESALLAGLGIFLGLLLGDVATRLLAAVLQMPMAFQAANAWLAVSVALILNLAFASWPALRAARLDPILALQSD